VLGAGGEGCAATGQAASENNATVVIKRSFMDASL
jgi:hypothetical protein